MSLTLGGTNPAVTFPDGTTQSTAANITAPYTANGVVYASSTSALATGSALTFDGTNFYTSGSINAGSGKFFAFSSSAASASNFSLYGDSSTTVINVPSSGVVQFNIANSEKMRLTSAGYLGIGTSSPTASLTVNGNISIPERTSAVIGVDYATTSGNGGNLTVRAGDGSGSGNTSGNLYLAFGRGGASASNGYMAFGVAQSDNSSGLNTEYMRLDASGNLGLGVTPSAWGNGKAIEVGYAGNSIWSYTGTGNDLNLSYNAYYNAGYKYGRNGYASLYDMSSTHAWFVAPSGTAGTAISFTQAMTLDNSGNLLVGTTTAKTTLTVNGGGVTGLNGSSFAWQHYQQASSSYTATSIQSVLSGASSYLTFSTNSNWTNANAAEAMRIDSSGDLYVNCTSALSVDNGFISVQSTTTHPALSVLGYSGSTWAMKIGTTSTDGTRYIIGICNNSAATLGGITTNGTVITYGGTSDYRLKENVQPMVGALEKINQLNPVTYTWKSNGSHGDGFIAHELQSVFPDAVAGEKDAVETDGSIRPQLVDQSKLVATLVKAIQELNAEIQSLKAEVATLKGA